MPGIIILVWVVLVPILAVTGYFALEVITGLSPLRRPPMDRGPACTTIVIPAHDEEAVIGKTVTGLLRKVSSDFQLLVIADNCSDSTSDIAREAGAKVHIRNDPDHRGKGFALAAALEQLRASPPDVVIVMDADCRTDRNSLEVLAGAASSTGRPCQTVNLLTPDLSAPPMVQISTFAFMIKNLIRQRGLQRLAGRAHLTGTGMALPWAIFATADLGGSNIVEDVALGLDLADRSLPPLLVEGANVWSPPASASGTIVQRRRWEGGYLGVALKSGPRALFRSIVRADLKGFCAALNIMVPPLALLALMNVLGFVLATGTAVFASSIRPLLAQLCIGLLALAALILAWLREGRAYASGSTLLRLPAYVLWKLPMYLGLVRRGAPKEWLRTGR